MHNLQKFAHFKFFIITTAKKTCDIYTTHISKVRTIKKFMALLYMLIILYSNTIVVPIGNVFHTFKKKPLQSLKL